MTGMHAGDVELVGRRSSHFTRTALMFAQALGVPLRFVHVEDMRVLDAARYGGNPALKLPVLRLPEGMVLGTLNICRALARHERANRALRIVWPEDLREPWLLTFQELVWHAMDAQVQLVMSARVFHVPPGQPYFDKVRTGMQAALGWLDQHVDALHESLPVPRDLSVVEVTLFCLVEHLTFRPMLPGRFARLEAFAARYGASPGAQATGYAVEPPR